MLREWEKLPTFMRLPEVKPYYESLRRKRIPLVLKRCFDLVASLVLLGILSIPMLIIAAWIKMDSPGPTIYRQYRVTKYGKRFRIHKFRTMVTDAESKGSGITVRNDNRITRCGAVLRRFKLDELPQLFDVVSGDMSFVGTRPEAVKYVELYKPEYYATLLMPAGITSEASIRYKDESKLLDAAENVDQVYMEQVLPAKMKWNLASIKSFGIMSEGLTMVRTVLAVLGRDYLQQDAQRGDS